MLNVKLLRALGLIPRQAPRYLGTTIYKLFNKSAIRFLGRSIEKPLGK